MEFNIVRKILSIVICGIGLGYWLAPSWFGIVELFGVAAMIGGLVFTVKDLDNLEEQVTWQKNLRRNLFPIGFGLIFFSTLAAHYSGFKSIARYVVVLCLWITLSRGALDISSLLNKFQLGLLLYIATGISVGLGYLGSIFFNLDLDLNLNF